ncbi:MAG TPA: ATPase, T2SS/T4P/T4SS family [Syntrophales bacterium]|nr:ATPase, T2SS/T4P/T4SS family [Syntrophales bacterium]
MYEAFYGLKEKPFNLNPDPDYLYMSPGHENAYTHLEYAIQESKGFVVVTGEVGSGKTTLINYLLRKIPETVHVGIINNTFVDPQELLKMICQEFELEIGDSDKTVLLTRFYSYLIDQYSQKKRVILIIDEAQNLPEASLEEIRMLSNLESEKHHLIQMILVGQPQLKEKLQRKSLEQFVQRVTVYCHLDALDKVQVENYIHHRLRVAGAENLDIFDPDAVKALYRHSLGIPRLINTLCDGAMVYGYADEVKVIGRDLIEAVAQARDLGGKEKEEGAIPPEKADFERSEPAAVAGFVKELESRINALEKKLAAQDENLIAVQHALRTMNGQRDEKDKTIIKLIRMLKKSMESRSKLIVQIARLRDKYEPQETTAPKKVSVKSKENSTQKSFLPINKGK